MHVYIISQRERIVITRLMGKPTGRYQQYQEDKGWVTILQKSFDANMNVNVIEELLNELKNV